MNHQKGGVNLEAKRMSVTILPEWEKDLDKLKQEKFYDKPRSEMIRFLIELGLEKSKKQNKKAG